MFFSDLLNEYYSEKGFMGSVLVASEGEVVYQGSYGFADLENSVHNTVNTKYRIGSLSKQFTAFSTLILVEMGKLSLNDKVTDYFPELAGVGDPLTIKHLLTHSSGLADFLHDPRFEAMCLRPVQSMKIIDLFRDVPLRFEPGSRFEYNNSGFYLLGLLPERLLGLAYLDFLKRYIFDAIGMSDSGFTPWVSVPNHASGYVFKVSDTHKQGLDSSSYHAVPNIDASSVGGAGGLYSTIGDMYRWDRMLFKETLIKRELFDEMFSPHIPVEDSLEVSGVKGSYGYGVFVDESGGGKVFHFGGFAGYRSMYSHYVDSDSCIIILSNVEMPLKLITSMTRDLTEQIQ